MASASKMFKDSPLSGWYLCVDFNTGRTFNDMNQTNQRNTLHVWLWGRRWLVLYKVALPCSKKSLFSFGIWCRMSFKFRFGSLSAPYLGDEDAQRVVAWDQWQWQEWMFFCRLAMATKRIIVDPCEVVVFLMEGDWRWTATFLKSSWPAFVAKGAKRVLMTVILLICMDLRPMIAIT